MRRKMFFLLVASLFALSFVLSLTSYSEEASAQVTASSYGDCEYTVDRCDEINDPYCSEFTHMYCESGTGKAWWDRLEAGEDEIRVSFAFSEHGEHSQCTSNSSWYVTDPADCSNSEFFDIHQECPGGYDYYRPAGDPEHFYVDCYEEEEIVDGECDPDRPGTYDYDEFDWDGDSWWG